MEYPRFIYDNSLVEALAPAAITTSAVDSGYSEDNVAERREFINYRNSTTGAGWIRFDFGAPVQIKALGIAGHKFNSQGITGVNLSADNAGASHPLANTIVSSFTPGSDRALARFFDATYQYWELGFTVPASAYAEIGVIFLAASFLEFENLPRAPFAPDRERAQLTETIGDEGHLLGVVTKFRERLVTLSFNNVDPTWVDNNFWPFIDNNSRRPFFFIWDEDTRPNEVSYVRLVDEEVRAPYDQVWRSITLNLKGLFDAR